MADDIVTRLREHSPAMCGACDTWGQCGYGEPCDCRCHMNFCQEAADEIERLRAERDMLADAVTAQVSPDLSPETARLLLRNAIAELEARYGI